MSSQRGHRHPAESRGLAALRGPARWLDTSSVARSCLADLAVCQKQLGRRRLRSALLKLHRGRRLHRRWREHHLVVRPPRKSLGRRRLRKKPLLRRPHRNHPASHARKSRLLTRRQRNLPIIRLLKRCPLRRLPRRLPRRQPRAKRLLRRHPSLRSAIVSALKPEDIRDFDKNPPEVQQLLASALELTGRGLGYVYGSADPLRGGMDCSGTIYFLLQKAGIAGAPRSASEQYVWVRKANTFQAVISNRSDSFEFNALRPGDLLFWTGTYAVKSDPPVTHSMIYLGKAHSDGRPLMVGASDGRTYRGEQKFGVSVFDFVMPKGKNARDI